MNETTIPPDFHAVGLDVTRNYSIAPEDAKHINRIIDVFFYDKNTHTHCCEATPSYFLQYLYTFIDLKEGTPDNLVDRLDQHYCHENTDNCYMHTRDVDSLKEFHIAFPLKPGEEIPTEEEVREFWQGNCPF